MTNDIITTAANLALALSVIVALIFGVAQVKTAARDRRERLTLEALRNFQTREFAELIHSVTTLAMPSSREELQALPTSEQVLFIQLSQQMESLGILVAEGLIDIDLVDKTLGSFVSTTWGKYKPLFHSIRDETVDPFLAEYFQWLAERIDERLREHPRRPFHETNPSIGQRL